MVLLEYLEHLVLSHHLAQLRGVVRLRYSEQQSVEIRFQSEEVDLFRAGEHTAVIIVLIAVDIIESRIELSQSLHQFHLRPRFRFPEHFDGLGSFHLVAVDGHIGSNNFLHAVADSVHLSQRQFLVRAFFRFNEVDIVALRHRDIDVYRAVRNHLVCSLVQYKEQRSRIGAVCRTIVHIQEFHLFRIIHPIVHAFHLIIHSCIDRTILHLEPSLRKNFRKCASDVAV